MRARNVTCIPMEKARRDLNTIVAVFPPYACIMSHMPCIIPPSPPTDRTAAAFSGAHPDRSDPAVVYKTGGDVGGRPQWLHLTGRYYTAHYVRTLPDTIVVLLWAPAGVTSSAICTQGCRGKNVLIEGGGSAIKNTKKIAGSGVARCLIIFLFLKIIYLCKVNGPHGKGLGHSCLPITG